MQRKNQPKNFFYLLSVNLPLFFDLKSMMAMPKYFLPKMHNYFQKQKLNWEKRQFPCYVRRAESNFVKGGKWTKNAKQDLSNTLIWFVILWKTEPSRTGWTFKEAILQSECMLDFLLNSLCSKFYLNIIVYMNIDEGEGF